ncbi:MAG: fibronectin type III domain-containing protein [Terrisporobacter sp.]
MIRKVRNVILVFFTLSLIISNMGNGVYSFAQDHKVNQNIIISKNMDNKNCKPYKVTNLHVALKNSTSMKLQWKRVSGADGYIICRSTAKNGIYKKIEQTCGKTPSYLDENLKSGTEYYYKVRAYTKVNDKICCGCYSDILNSTTCPAKVENLHTSCISKSSIKIEWDKVCNASGYEVCRATSSTGTYTKIGTITDGSKPYYTDKDLKSGKKYLYKVRAFKEVNGQPCFGDSSKALSTRTKK